MPHIPLLYWIGFHALVVLLLLADLFLLQSRHGAVPAKLAWAWTAFLAGCALAFAFLISQARGQQPALEFLSGYLIEASLSVDNLFVFLLLFRSFGLNVAEQRRALLWGVTGAILIRAGFIVAGVSLLERFDWVQYIFGAFLLFAAARLLRHSPAPPGDGHRHEPSRWVAWLQRHASRSGGVLPLRAFLLIIVAVEVTDLIFALDSIPAVLAVTRRPSVAYTSNVFAILGLRSLYFALQSLLDRLRLLHYGLALILGFVALKMLAAHWIAIPIVWSLAVILAVIAAFVVLSLVLPDGRRVSPAPAARTDDRMPGGG